MRNKERYPLRIFSILVVMSFALTTFFALSVSAQNPTPKSGEVFSSGSNGPLRGGVQYHGGYGEWSGIATDPAVRALMSCDHSLRNASGGPYHAAEILKSCDQYRQIKPLNLAVKAIVEECWSLVDAARREMETASSLYLEADRMRGHPASRGPLEQAKRHHESANALIAQEANCTDEAIVQSSSRQGAPHSRDPSPQVNQDEYSGSSTGNTGANTLDLNSGGFPPNWPPALKQQMSERGCVIRGNGEIWCKSSRTPRWSDNTPRVPGGYDPCLNPSPPPGCPGVPSETGELKPLGCRVTPEGGIGCDTNTQAGETANNAQGQRGATNQRGALRPVVDAINYVVDKFPGLEQALITGEAVTQQMADQIKSDYNMAASPDAGLRLIRDTLLGEAQALAGVAGKTVLKAGAAQLKNLVSKTPSLLERQLAPTLVVAEEAEDIAIANAIVNKRLETLTDLQKLSKLRNQERGANARINKIVYELEVIERKEGGKAAEMLSAALDANGYTGPAKELALRNLVENWKRVREANVFTDWNLIRMKFGFSATLDLNGLKLDIDHLVPIKISLGNSQIIDLSGEIGTVLANLRLTPSNLNRSMQNIVTPQVFEYAQQLNNAGLLSDQSLHSLEQAVRYVR
ncbi:hypothetical protein [Candidatus Thiodictyon syntrophicum]|jgi:hypothetical protein|nr:hypothetical protein [Candidatus Thiodictyon syntrophicum]